MPPSAVTGRADVMDAVHPGGLGGTHTGNPVACAAALAAITWMRDEDACALTRNIETVLRGVLERLRADHGVIGEVRGRGAMLAAEIVRPGESTPDPATAAAIQQRCFREGVITLVTGTHGNVIRFLPPLSISEGVLAEALDVVSEAVTAGQG